MSSKKKIEEATMTTRISPPAPQLTTAVEDELREAVREHLLYLAGRGQHTSTTARRLAEVVSK